MSLFWGLETPDSRLTSSEKKSFLAREKQAKDRARRENGSTQLFQNPSGTNLFFKKKADERAKWGGGRAKGGQIKTDFPPGERERGDPILFTRWVRGGGETEDLRFSPFSRAKRRIFPSIFSLRVSRHSRRRGVLLCVWVVSFPVSIAFTCMPAQKRPTFLPSYF